VSLRFRRDRQVEAEGGQHGVVQKIILLQATHVFVGFLAKEHSYKNDKRQAVANGSRKRLKAVHFGEHGDSEACKATGLESGKHGDARTSNCPQGRRRNLV
jgi:hypothetical protein